MNRAVIILAALAVAAIVVVSAAFNVMLAASLGTTPHEKAAFIAAALAFDILKATLLIFTGILLSRRKFGMGAVTVLLWCGCLAWSSASAIGFAALSRGAVVASRAGEADTRQAAEAKVSRISEAIKWVPQHRPAGVIEAAIATARAAIDPAVWRATKECAAITKTASADACKPVLALRSELSAATEAARLEAELAEARGTLARAGGVTGDAFAADPQGEALAGLLGRPVADVRHGLGFLLAGMIEAISALGFAVIGAAGGRTPNRRELATVTSPEPATVASAEPIPLASEIATVQSLPAGVAAETSLETSRAETTPLPLPSGPPDTPSPSVSIAPARETAETASSPRGRKRSRRVKSRAVAVVKAKALATEWAAAQLARKKGGTVTAADAYAAFSRWCELEGREVATPQAFREVVPEILRARGGNRTRCGDGVKYRGVALRADAKRTATGAPAATARAMSLNGTGNGHAAPMPS